MGRVPVILLSGYLGSGKTTLLLHLLKEAKNKGFKFGMIINEFGKMDVDGLILGGRSTASIQTLHDGCVCCSKKSELINSFEELLKKNPDVIFVELTGVANPGEVIVEMMRKELVTKIFLQRLVTVVDAEAILFEAHSSMDKSFTFEQQISAADSIIVNKIDLVDDWGKNKIINLIKEKKPDTEVIYTSYSQVDLDTILSRKIGTGSPERAKLVLKETSKEENLSYDFMSTISLPIPFTVTKRLIEDYFSQLQPNLIRAKGFVRLEDENIINLVQFYGTRVSWEVFEEYEGEPFVTLIGVDLDAKKVFEELIRNTKMSNEDFICLQQ